MKQWQLLVSNNSVRPNPTDLIVRATLEAEVLPAQDIIDGNTLHNVWPDIIRATHPTTGYAYRTVAPSIFDPINLDNFLAIRCRAVSSLEKWGCNNNGDGFPADDLAKSYLTLIAKGFYKEHRSYDPKNAVGILAHAQWMPLDQYIIVVALIDKLLFPHDAEEIRRTLNNKKAGVSIGCIAGLAQCSECGNIARTKQQICGCMDRGNPFCIKGKKQSDGHVAHDICRDLTFYELSYTKLPADRAALGQYVFGADLKDKEEEVKPEETKPVTNVDVTIPDQAALDRMVETIVNKILRGRTNKLIKTIIEQEMGPILKELQVKLKPQVKEVVQERKEDVEEAVEVVQV